VALFDLLLEENKIAKHHSDFEVITNILSNNPDLIKFLNHPQITKTEKKEFIKHVFGQVDQTLINFLLVLIDNNRIQDMSSIYQAYLTLFHEYNEILIVKAVTSVPLTEKQINQLQTKLTIKYKKRIEVTNTIDHAIIGGIRLMIKDKIVDHTIISHLTNLKSYVLKQN
jgi:F-type H+-transporting ATPase subunit delta